MMTDAQIRQIFAEEKAILTGGHFVYAKKEDGWYHGKDYVNKDAIYCNPYAVQALCSAIAEMYSQSGVQVVIGPTVGGVALAQWVAWHLGRGVTAVCADEEDVFESKSEEIGYVSTGDIICCKCNVTVTGGASALVKIDEKVGTRRVIRRGYSSKVAGKRCLIVDDVTDFGTTLGKTIAAVQSVGGIVVGVAVLCNRSGGKVSARSLNVTQLYSLLNLDLAMVKEEECSDCAAGIMPSMELGKGKEFLVRLSHNYLKCINTKCGGLAYWVNRLVGIWCCPKCGATNSSFPGE